MPVSPLEPEHQLEASANVTMAATKTLAFQIPEELDRRLKNFIATEKKRGKKISQKEFVIGLIEQALAEYETQILTQPTTEA